MIVDHKNGRRNKTSKTKKKKNTCQVLSRVRTSDLHLLVGASLGGLHAPRHVSAPLTLQCGVSRFLLTNEITRRVYGPVISRDVFVDK